MRKILEEILAPKPETRPCIYAYAIGDPAHAGLPKIGQTPRGVKQRVPSNSRPPTSRTTPFRQKARGQARARRHLQARRGRCPSCPPPTERYAIARTTSQQTGPPPRPNGALCVGLIHVSPFQGWVDWGTLFPGRCPGLSPLACCGQLRSRWRTRSVLRPRPNGAPCDSPGQRPGKEPHTSPSPERA